MTTFLSGALFLLSLCSGFLTGNALAPHTPAPPVLGATLPQAVAVFETSLASPITSSAATMTLTANAIRGGGTLSGYNCFTVDEGSAQAETICGTISGTTVSSLSRGISQSTGTTTVASLQFSHRRGANVKITDFPIIQILKAQANGEDTYPNLIYYANGTACNGASPSTAICGKGYSDALIAQGAATSSETVTGISRLATQLQAASSTDLGANTPLVLQAKYATSSPGTAGLWAVITNNAGKIAQTFFDLTASTTYSGHNIFTATTSIKANSVTTSPLVLNGVAYSFPVGNGASSTALLTNGAGALSWGAPPLAHYTRIAASSLTVNNSTSSSTQVLTIPANTLTASTTIKVYGVGTSASTVSNDCKVYLRETTGSGTTLASALLGSVSGRTYSGQWDMIIVFNGLAAQNYNSRAFMGDTGSISAIAATINGATSGASAYNFANAANLAVVIQETTGANCSESNAVIEVIP